jgi:predicted Ser/Thr protein kinase
VTIRPDSRLGTDLGPYRIEAVIGRGGMGVVYRAEQTRLGRKVALKVLAPDLLDDEAFRARFVRESQMAAAIDHPNIIPIYEAGEEAGAFFLAMRYVEGTDLETRLRSGSLEPREAVQLLAQVASALDAANEAGLVHRDVKPANVLIASGKGVERADHAYLTDFGLSKHRGSQSGLTQSGTFMGTLDYIAPEQIEGRPVDGRTDQYSLTAMAFHCLTGAPPFPRDTDIAIAMAHLREALPSASAARPDLPAAIDAVLARGMAKNADDRYPSSEAMVGALRQALGVRITDQQVIPARRDRRRLTLIATGLIVLALLVMAGAFWASGRATPGGSPSASPTTQAIASPTARPTSAAEAFPTLDEVRLIAAIPPETDPSCTRGDDALLPSRQGMEVKPRAHVTCRMLGGAGPDTLDGWYVTPGTPVYAADVVVGLGTGQGAIEAPCESDGASIGGWPEEGDFLGAYLCYQDPDTGAAVIAWSTGDWGVYRISASDGDRRSLRQWWLANRAAITP